jgi:hypothetical protein
MVTPKTIPRKRLLMAVGLTAFLLASGATYFIYSSRSNVHLNLSQVPILKQVLKGASSNPQTPTQGSQASQASVTPPTGWKTFSSAKYSFNYPGDWFDARDNSLKQNSPYEMFVSNESVIYPKPPSANGIQVHSSYLAASGFPDVDKTAFSTSVGNFKISGTYDTNIVFTKLSDFVNVKGK